jgi:ADP-ribosylglycohydrolase
MLGAIAGDIIGSVYERSPVKKRDFSLFSIDSTFTDDTVLSVAVAKVLLSDKDYDIAFREFYLQYPNQGYGYGFSRWVQSDSNNPYNSYGNGSAMRVNPVGWAFDSLPEVLHEAKQSAIITHNHPEGVKGAQAVAAAIYLARTGHSKPAIKDYLSKTFLYDLERPLDDIRPDYTFDVSCQGSVPESIIAFLESSNYEDAVRNAVSLGGDSDTMACIAGAIAEAYYKYIDPVIIAAVFERLPAHLATITKQFTGKYCQY